MRRIIFRILLTLVIFNGLFVLYVVYLDYNISVVSEGEKIKDCDSTRTALWVIDIREAKSRSAPLTDDCPKQADISTHPINALIDRAKNYHIPVIYNQNETTDWIIKLIDNSMQKGYAGAALDQRIKIVSGNIVSKTRMGILSSPSLDSLLLSLEANKLFVTRPGAACFVRYALQAVENRGYKFAIIKGELISESDSLKEIMIRNFESQDIGVIELAKFPQNEQ